MKNCSLKILLCSVLSLISCERVLQPPVDNSTECLSINYENSFICFKETDSTFVPLPTSSNVGIVTSRYSNSTLGILIDQFSRDSTSFGVSCNIETGKLDTHISLLPKNSNQELVSLKSFELNPVSRGHISTKLIFDKKTNIASFRLVSKRGSFEESIDSNIVRDFTPKLSFNGEWVFYIKLISGLHQGVLFNLKSNAKINVGDLDLNQLEPNQIAFLGENSLVLIHNGNLLVFDFSSPNFAEVVTPNSVNVKRLFLGSKSSELFLVEDSIINNKLVSRGFLFDIEMKAIKNIFSENSRIIDVAVSSTGKYLSYTLNDDMLNPNNVSSLMNTLIFNVESGFDTKKKVFETKGRLAVWLTKKS